MPIELYGAYLLVVTAFFATPPDTSQLLIVSNSINYGLRRSWLTMAGDLSANAIQMIAAALGLAAVISQSQSAFVWIKWLGVAYLCWIGVQVFFSKTGAFVQEQGGGQVSSFNLFRQGFFTSLSNPYAIVFFAALFPQFLSSGSSVYFQVFILGSTYLVFDGVMLLVWGYAGQTLARRLTGDASLYISKICGLIMILAALLLATKNLGPG